MADVRAAIATGKFDAVIVGGGISGLYCARQLVARGLDRVVVLELRDQLGGRIETGDLRGFVDDTSATRPVFGAEFGPMRFELGIQPLFAALCSELGIDFDTFSSPRSPKSPISYPLRADECGTDGVTPLSPLQLLKLGLFRLFSQATRTVEAQDANGIQYEVELQDSSWLDRLNDDAPDGFDSLRRTAINPFTGQPLWREGFWNALGRTLSPLAVRMIQNEGTFYHLIPQNPNAVEWAIFWLRIFKHPTMKTIPSGVRTITDRLHAQLASSGFREHVTIIKNAEVTAVRATDEGRAAIVDFLQLAPTEVRDNRQVIGDHVVLAIPKAPLLELTPRSLFPDNIVTAFNSVIGFTLLKVFLCGRVPPWWPPVDPPAPQDRSWLTSTREVHYFREGANAITLLYMDEPSSGRWAPFVQAPGRHDCAEYGGNLELKRDLVEFVFDAQRAIADQLIPKPQSPREPMVDSTDPAARELLRFVEGEAAEWPDRPEWQSAAFSQMRPEVRSLLARVDQVLARYWADVSDYAIRDWSRSPFGAGCHAWRLGVASWEVRETLSAFPLTNDGPEIAHVCGEAYSDYQGFIEGALRSAEDAIERVLGLPAKHLGPW